ncbi:uncharacterized protein LOC105232349 isoform X1 [Bactrocera dorsalis]|uniref:Uncharacterized protein LOC105232349 isoform X1 n=1 Tax=Bactrocera dorsalis TaxID=27457 RepID=A0A6I9VNQ4_BACDO|nr:uncharacterized protein LOC105232349 isoform X1 [Bactrocera dorsalis]
MWANDKPDRSFELNLARGKKQSSCSPGWMYSIGEAFVGLSAADELPDGYATSVGFGERFRNGEFLPLFSEYPLLIYLLILGILVTVCGIAYVIYRWRVGTPLYRYLDNEISKELSMWFCMCYILALITCVFLLFSIAIMLTANKNIRKTKEDRAWRLKLADESINEIISKLENVNFARPLENVNQISAKFHRAIERKAQPYLGESLRSVDNLDLVNYKSDVNELLETFAHCNAYMLHFLDSWRYYDTNATRFAKLVNTMESRKALQAVRRVREDFANVVYKVMQQNRAFYNYYRELETLSDEMLTEHVKNNDRSLEFANTIDKNLQNIETKLEALGTSLQQRANKIYELKENLLEVSSGAGYIEFSDTLITFGYVVSILMMLIVFLALIFMPLWYLGSLYCRKCKWIAGILPLTTAAFIFIFYLVFVLTIMYYFLHGMVAKDGICDGKRALDAGRADIIDDCIINSAIFENYSHTKAKSIYDTSTSEIEAALKAIETLPRRVKRAPTTKPSAAEKFERFRINKTVIQDIYVEMLKVAVYAPKNIEPFALIWHANRLSKVKALQELNCTHAIGNTMAVSLHGQVASEMDKLYRTTWRVEALLQDLPTQLKANRDDTGDFDGITELTKNLRAIFNAGKEPLRRIISHSAGPKLPTCKSVAQLYKSLKTPACECLVPSMNLYWFGAFVAICLLLLLLALILCLEEMIRRSALSNRESRSRLKPSKSHHSHRGRGSSRTRSSSRPGTRHSTRSNTSYSTRNNTPYSTRAGTPHSTRPNSPYSDRLDTPYSSHAATPYSTRATTPYSSHPDTPYTSRSNSPHSSRRVTPYTSRHVSPYAGTPHTTRARSNERTPTRGTSLALKHPPENAPYFVDYRRFGVDDPFVQQFTERLSRRDMLPRHLQRQQQQQPSHGQRDMKDNFTFESYPDMPAKLQQARSLERKPDKRKEPRNVWKNEAFRYPGPGGSDISTMLQCFRGPRSISKTLEQRGRSQPSERSANIHHKEPTLIAQRSTNETLVDGPTTSGAIPKIKLPPGKVGIVVCPCGCGKPSKIYGTKQDIERIRKAGKVCIAKRGQQFKDKRLRPLASVVELKGTEEGNEDVA